MPPTNQISFHTSYLSFFLHEQNFWRIKFTPKKRVNYEKIHRKLPIFCIKSLKIYTGQKKFTREYPWLPWQIWGMRYPFLEFLEDWQLLQRPPAKLRSEKCRLPYNHLQVLKTDWSFSCWFRHRLSLKPCDLTYSFKKIVNPVPKIL